MGQTTQGQSTTKKKESLDAESKAENSERVYLLALGFSCDLRDGHGWRFRSPGFTTPRS